MPGLHFGMFCGADRPLHAGEERDLRKAHVWAMDVEVDGGTLPADIDRFTQAGYVMTLADKRRMLEWFYATAPGNY